MQVVLRYALALVAFFALIPSALAEGELGKLDEALNRWKTLDYNLEVVTSKPDKEKSVLEMRMRMRVHDDNNQQIVEISKPADMKGTKVLVKSPTKMYIYLPAFGKVRRIASHVTEQGFLGTALSQKDMTLTRYSDKYDASVVSDDGTTIVLRLTAKGDGAPYPKIELDVEKKRWLPTKIRYYGEDDKHIKSEDRKDYKCKEKHCTPGTMVITDHTSDTTSTITLKKFEVNSDLPAEIFSKRYLMN
jgi:outer membrane lipoprotein-sorting protein